VRIASLLPAATEIVTVLGRGDDLVAVTYECDAAAREHAAVVVDTALPQGLAPAAIDAVVRDRAARGLPMYELDRAALAELDPDLIITQDLCRVCALPAGTVTDALDAIGCTADVLSVDPHSVDDVLAAIIAVGERVGAATEAQALVGGLRDRLAAVGDAVAGRARPRVLVLEWTDPPFLAGHWVPELVRRAGGTPVGGTDGGRSVSADWSEVTALAADVVLVAPCGFGLDAARDQFPRRGRGGGGLRCLRRARRPPARRRDRGHRLGAAPGRRAAAATGAHCPDRQGLILRDPHRGASSA
jgi:iron complex transport system substrate-binding protein